MTIQAGSIASAAEVVTSFGRLIARETYAANVSDATGDEYFKKEKYTTATGGTGTTAKFSSGDLAYEIGISDEASGDTTFNTDSWSNPTNAFDANDATYAEKTYSNTAGFSSFIGKTFGAKTVKWVRVVVYASANDGTAPSGTYVVQSYNGATWSDIAATSTNFANGATVTGQFFINTGSIQGLRVQVTANSDSGNADGSVRCYSFEYGSLASSAVVIEQAVFSKTPKSMVIYANTTLPTNTTITVDISEDNGANWALTGKAFDTYIDTTTLTLTQIALRFNLATTDTSTSPQLHGWSAVITNT